MSLRKALDRLPGDRATESTVQEVLQLLRLYAGEPMSASEVARRVERPENEVAMILLRLADAFVLQRDDLHYTYERDPLLDLDVDRFMRRVETHSVYVQSNVARFRDRFGSR